MGTITIDIDTIVLLKHVIIYKNDTQNIEHLENHITKWFINLYENNEQAHIVNVIASRFLNVFHIMNYNSINDIFNLFMRRNLRLKKLLKILNIDVSHHSNEL